MGTPGFAVAILDALLDAGHEICAVYTQPPRPAGRGRKLLPSAVQARAARIGLPVCHPKVLTDSDAHGKMTGLAADAAVVAAYGLILPRQILTAFPHGCLNVHASLLPRWRGAAPVQRAVMAGDRQTGVSIMVMDEGLDTGPILMRRTTPIGSGDTAGTVSGRLAAMGAEAMLATLDRLGELHAEPQQDQCATYASKLSSGDAVINWAMPARQVDCHIRGLSPAPGAWTMLGKTRLKCLHSSEAADGDAGRLPGTVLDDRMTVACGEGTVRIGRLQRPGRPATDTAAFLRGTPVPPGTVLGAQQQWQPPERS